MLKHSRELSNVFLISRVVGEERFCLPGDFSPFLHDDNNLQLMDQGEINFTLIISRDTSTRFKYSTQSPRSFQDETFAVLGKQQRRKLNFYHVSAVKRHRSSSAPKSTRLFVFISLRRMLLFRFIDVFMCLASNECACIATKKNY